MQESKYWVLLFASLVGWGWSLKIQEKFKMNSQVSEKWTYFAVVSSTLHIADGARCVQEILDHRILLP